MNLRSPGQHRKQRERRQEDLQQKRALFDVEHPMNSRGRLRITHFRALWEEGALVEADGLGKTGKWERKMMEGKAVDGRKQRHTS